MRAIRASAPRHAPWKVRRRGLTRSLATSLEPGGAVAAILVEHTWERALADAITRIGGEQAISDFVEAGDVTELSAQLAGLGSR